MDTPTALDFEELRIELLRQRDILSARPTAGAAETYADKLDRAAQLARHTAEISLSNHANLQLNKIAAALARMARGEYGACAECVAPIGIRRLRASPSAIYCVDCQCS